MGAQPIRKRFVKFWASGAGAGAYENIRKDTTYDCARGSQRRAPTGIRQLRAAGTGHQSIDALGLGLLFSRARLRLTSALAPAGRGDTDNAVVIRGDEKRLELVLACATLARLGRLPEKDSTCRVHFARATGETAERGHAPFPRFCQCNMIEQYAGSMFACNGDCMCISTHGHET